MFSLKNIALACLFSGILSLPASAQSNDFTRLNGSQIDAIMNLAQSDDGKFNECRKKCTGTLDEATACSDWCRCKHKTDNSDAKCDKEYTDTTGKSPPKAVNTPIAIDGCTKCSIRPIQTKMCVIEDYLGPEEDFTFQANCAEDVQNDSCSECTQSFIIERVCCTDGTCQRQPCVMERPFGLPASTQSQ